MKSLSCAGDAHVREWWQWKEQRQHETSWWVQVCSDEPPFKGVDSPTSDWQREEADRPKSLLMITPGHPQTKQSSPTQPVYLRGLCMADPHIFSIGCSHLQEQGNTVARLHLFENVFHDSNDTGIDPVIIAEVFLFACLCVRYKLPVQQPENVQQPAGARAHPAEFTNLLWTAELCENISVRARMEERRTHSFTGAVCRSIAPVLRDCLHFNVHVETWRLHPEASLRLLFF